jgi:hypothetical protein
MLDGITHVYYLHAREGPAFSTTVLFQERTITTQVPKDAENLLVQP